MSLPKSDFHKCRNCKLKDAEIQAKNIKIANLEHTICLLFKELSEQYKADVCEKHPHLKPIIEQFDFNFTTMRIV